MDALEDLVLEVIGLLAQLVRDLLHPVVQLLVRQLQLVANLQNETYGSDVVDEMLTNNWLQGIYGSDVVDGMLLYLERSLLHVGDALRGCRVQPLEWLLEVCGLHEVVRLLPHPERGVLATLQTGLQQRVCILIK